MAPTVPSSGSAETTSGWLGDDGSTTIVRIGRCPVTHSRPQLAVQSDSEPLQRALDGGSDGRVWIVPQLLHRRDVLELPRRTDCPYADRPDPRQFVLEQWHQRIHQLAELALRRDTGDVLPHPPGWILRRY
jgi:hypothetical protein